MVSMADLKNPKVIYFKGVLFLLLGMIASAMLLSDAFSLRNVALLAIVIWSFCRAYYFVFYVIEHYIDSQYRFAGLFDFAKYLAGKRS